MEYQPPEFDDGFDDEFAVTGDGNRAFFGREVLRGLVEGIDDFAALRQQRWRESRSYGPVLLGSAMWMDDGELIARISRLTGACVVVTKQRRSTSVNRKLDQLLALNERGPGLPTSAVPGFEELLPKVNGRPAVVGPSTPMGAHLPTVRTVGFRRLGPHLVPLLHAKLAVLGHLRWHDEGPLGDVADITWFTPQRLWVSSANFTSASRDSLEFGYWTEDRELVAGATRFLISLIAASEGLDPDADTPDPDLVPYEFDDVAMAEAAADQAALFGDSEDWEPETQRVDPVGDTCTVRR